MAQETVDIWTLPGDTSNLTGAAGTLGVTEYMGRTARLDMQRDWARKKQPMHIKFKGVAGIGPQDPMWEDPERDGLHYQHTLKKLGLPPEAAKKNAQLITDEERKLQQGWKRSKGPTGYYWDNDYIGGHWPSVLKDQLGHPWRIWQTRRYEYRDPPEHWTPPPGLWKTPDPRKEATAYNIRKAWEAKAKLDPLRAEWMQNKNFWNNPHSEQQFQQWREAHIPWAEKQQRIREQDIETAQEVLNRTRRLHPHSYGTFRETGYEEDEEDVDDWSTY